MRHKNAVSSDAVSRATCRACRAAMLVGPRGVEDHTVPVLDVPARLLEERGIRAVGPLRGVEAFASGRGGGLRGCAAGQPLSDLVGAQHGPTGPPGERVGERRFSGRGRPADEYQADPSAREMPGRQIEQSARRTRRGGIVGDAQARHLRPYDRPIRDVEVGERLRPRLACTRCVAVEEAASEVGAAEPLEVHREERDVGEHVAVAQGVVELEAVEHARTVVEAEDVVGQEIAVPVADPSARDPVEQQCGTSAEIPLARRT